MTAVHFSESLTLHTARSVEDPQEHCLELRSDPLHCDVRKPGSTCSPTVVPPISKVKKEEINSLTCSRYLIAPSQVPDHSPLSSSEQDYMSFNQMLRRPSRILRMSLGRRMSSLSLKEVERSMKQGSKREQEQKGSSPPCPVARRKSTIGVVTESGRKAAMGQEEWQMSSSGETSLQGCSSGGQARRTSLQGGATKTGWCGYRVFLALR